MSTQRREIIPGSKEYTVRLAIIRDKKIPYELKARCLQDFFMYGTLSKINGDLYMQYLENR